MLVEINERMIELENSLSSIERIIKEIESGVNESELYFSHLIIDGEEIFEDFELRIEEKVTSIRYIKVVMKTVGEFINDLLVSAENYLIRVHPELQILIDEFYQGPTGSSWVKLGQLMEGLQWINQLFEIIKSSKHKPGNWNEYLKAMSTFEKELNALEAAMEAKDQILIADILQFEILEIIPSLKTEVTETIDREGERLNVN
ncbi:hypothetical protein ERJ70_14430 [Sediminibacillus dalangtanensis]|uniref:LXG domain of WXG superfamily protein n=1 Tax=Sediminibacillus dalangtanensis TaxID=2729421 RepID=A0ABX7VWI1_9BACI|nr:hypothetical protein [Sediminibacillus dalangtanensis]QTN00390.1 hypothetical protein ERJ70_14430 [Sediminibacillus dalangtanensis]